MFYVREGGEGRVGRGGVVEACRVVRIGQGEELSSVPCCAVCAVGNLVETWVVARFVVDWMNQRGRQWASVGISVGTRVSRMAVGVLEFGWRMVCLGRDISGMEPNVRKLQILLGQCC